MLSQGVGRGVTWGLHTATAIIFWIRCVQRAGVLFFWPSFCCILNLLRILFSLHHFLVCVRCILSLSLAFSFMNIFMSLFSLCFLWPSSLRQWMSLLFWLSFHLTRSPIFTVVPGSAQKDSSFATVAMVICHPSPCKTGATLCHREATRLNPRPWSGAGSGWVALPMRSHMGLEWNRKQCRDAEVGGCTLCAGFLWARLIGRSHSPVGPAL